MPRISASSLVEYLGATAARRSAIITAAIAPPVYIVDRYGLPLRSASRAVYRRSTEPLEEAKKTVERITPRSDQHSQRLANTLEGLRRISELIEPLITEDIGFARPHSTSTCFAVEGVTVQVAPQAITFRRSQDGSLAAGVLKLHCSKSNCLSDEAAALYGALLHWFSEEKLLNIGPIDRSLCLGFDVFAGRRFSAPLRHVTRRRLIRNACIEIGDRWEPMANRLAALGRNLSEPHAMPALASTSRSQGARP